VGAFEEIYSLRFFSILRIMNYMIIILSCLIFLSLLAYLSKTTLNEKYKSPTTLPPNYTKYNTGLTEISTDPSGVPLAFDEDKNNFNYTQLYYAFLVQLFKTMSANKKEYPKNLVKYRAKNTVDYHDMDALNLLMKPLLKRMAVLSNFRTDFWITGYESWKVFQVINSPLKINEIDCFVYDRVGLTQIRLLIQLIELPNKDAVNKYECREIKDKKLETCAAMTTPEFPKYPIGIPSDDQLIPLPTEVIVSGKDIENHNGVDFPVPCSFEKLWINWVEIVNSSLVLNAFENFNDVQLEGINQIPFDYTKYTPPDGRQNPYQWSAQATNQWPTLNTQPKNLKAYPSTPVPFVWDSQGCRPEVHPTRRTPGIRTGLEQEPLTASYNPGMFDVPRKVTEYKWMFENSAVIPALQYEGY